MLVTNALVFKAEFHTSPDNQRDLSPECYKNRLWAFVLYKVPASSTGEKVREYAKSLLDTTEKAIDLSQSVTHALNADAFLADTGQSLPKQKQQKENDVDN